MYKRVLVISDLHIPYHHPNSFDFLKEIKKEYKPDFVVNIGDMLDFHAISFHTHDPDLYSAGHELKIARQYVKELESIYPEVVEVDSNHSSLVYRRGIKFGMRVADVLKVSQTMGMSAVQGHYHTKFLIQWWANPNNLFFAMNVGCLIDQKSMAFNYAKNFKTRFILGCGIIIDGVPRLLPMILDNKGKWIKKLV